MSTYHTPGPWAAYGQTVMAVSHGKWFTICHVNGTNHTKEGNEANAAFIASAPKIKKQRDELLAALDAIVTAVYNEEAVSPWSPEYRNALTAIAKARGQA